MSGSDYAVTLPWSGIATTCTTDYGTYSGRADKYVYTKWAECGTTDTYGTAGTAANWYNNIDTDSTCNVKWNTTGWNWYKASYNDLVSGLKPANVDPSQRISEIIASRQAPRIIIPDHRKAIQEPKDIREMRARETLKRVVGVEKYRSFQTKGFISVKGKDGKYYQLYPGHGLTHVFDQGQLVEKLCVVWPGDFTPTDSLIMRFLMILNNPAEFWAKAIKHGSNNSRKKLVVEPVEARNLSDIFRELKAKVA